LFPLQAKPNQNQNKSAILPPLPFPFQIL
jgi:hypothetical protein